MHKYLSTAPVPHVFDTALAEHIQVLEGVPTGIAMITVGENDNTIIVVPGANGKVDKGYVE